MSTMLGTRPRHAHRRKRTGPSVVLSAICAFVSGAALWSELRSQPKDCFIVLPKDLPRHAMATALAVATGMGTLASPMPSAFAEDASMATIADLEAKVSARTEGLLAIQREKTATPSIPKEKLEQLETKELEAAKQARDVQLKFAKDAELLKREMVDKQERESKALIEKQEKLTKSKIDSDLKLEKDRLSSERKGAFEQVKKKEQAAKQQALLVEKQEKQAAGRDEGKRVQAEEKLEAALAEAQETAEKELVAATEKYEQALSAALERADEAREKAAQTADTTYKLTVDAAEKARRDGAEKFEIFERTVLEDEEKVERDVIETVAQIEELELEEESASITTAKRIASTIWSVAAPLVIPGVAMFAYAVVASLFAPPPVPCRGNETEETRVAMGRGPRQKTVQPTLDPWDTAAA